MDASNYEHRHTFSASHGNIERGHFSSIPVSITNSTSQDQTPHLSRFLKKDCGCSKLHHEERADQHSQQNLSSPFRDYKPPGKVSLNLKCVPHRNPQSATRRTKAVISSSPLAKGTHKPPRREGSLKFEVYSEPVTKCRAVEIEVWPHAEEPVVTTHKPQHEKNSSLAVQTSRGSDQLDKKNCSAAISRVANRLTNDPSSISAPLSKPMEKKCQTAFCNQKDIESCQHHSTAPEIDPGTRRETLMDRKPFFHLFQHSFVALDLPTASSDTALFGENHCHAVLKEDLPDLTPPDRIPERLCEHLPPTTSSRVVRVIHPN